MNSSSTAAEQAGNVVYFEDLEQQYGAEQQEQYSGCLVTMVALGFLIAGAGFAAINSPLLVPICVGLGALLLLLAAIYNKLRVPKRPRLFCPNCARELDQARRLALLASRACPICLHVFPSRLPPQMRSVVFERAKLPRIWLQGEVNTAVVAEVVDDVPPVVSGVALNPYVAPPPVADAPATQPSFASAVRALLVAWFSAMTAPIRTLLLTDEQLLANPALSIHRDPPTPRSLRLRAAYVLSVRRQAWVQIVMWNLWPLLATALVVVWPLRATDALWLIIVCALGGHWFATMLGIIGYGKLLHGGPRWLSHWLSGGLRVMDADTDPDTGYYGLRWRLLDVAQQHDLPHLAFRFRQNRPGEVLLRLVNQDQACGWELPLPYDTPGEWQAAQVDLRALIRQSAPDFIGNELHLVSDPSSELELMDYQVIVRA